MCIEQDVSTLYFVMGVELVHKAGIIETCK